MLTCTHSDDSLKCQAGVASPTNLEFESTSSISPEHQSPSPTPSHHWNAVSMVVAERVGLRERLEQILRGGGE